MYFHPPGAMPPLPFSDPVLAMLKSGSWHVGVPEMLSLFGGEIRTHLVAVLVILNALPEVRSCPKTCTSLRTLCTHVESVLTSWQKQATDTFLHYIRTRDCSFITNETN